MVKDPTLGVRELAQWLGALAAITEDTCTFRQNTHNVKENKHT